jgi:HNH endonuclease
MGFPAQVRDDALVACGRHCCICHEFCGIKMELHHIIQRAEDGEDTLENCIPLCLDCHADMRSYDHKHPKGIKYTPKELRRHRDNWYAKIKGSPGSSYNDQSRELDRKVFIMIKVELPYDGPIRFLENHDFGAPFKLIWTDPLDAFLHKGDDPSREFLDADLEGMRAKLLKDVYEFLNFMAYNTFSLRETDFQSVNKELGYKNPARLQEVVSKLNSLSTAVASSYRTFVREGRRRLAVD